MVKAKKITTYINPKNGLQNAKEEWVDIQFDEEEGYLFWNRKSNVKSFLDTPLPTEFTWAERGRIHELKHYLLKDNQCLVYRSGNIIKPITVAEFEKILELSERQAKALIKKMKQHDIIKEMKIDGVIYFVFNPIYGLKGKRLTLNMYLLFQESLQKKLPQWVAFRFAMQAQELKPDLDIID